MHINLIVLSVFALGMIGIGWLSSRRVRNAEDFFVAGRSLSTPLVAFSLFATWFGAETCLGVSGAVYSEGLSGARADPLGYSLCLVLLGLVLARRLVERRLLTLGDLYRQAYGASVEKMLVLVLVPSGLLWGAAQIKAMGQVLSHLVGLEPAPATIVAASVTVGYTLFGGLWGDVLTDFAQGLLLIVGLVTLGCFVGMSEPLLEMWSRVPAERFDPIGHESWFEQLDRWTVPILGSLVTQEALARILGARSPQVARRGAFWAAGLYLCFGSIPVLLGLFGPELSPGLQDTERLLPELSRHYLPPVLSAVFNSALLAAMLSTVDSVLLSTSALCSRNLLSSVFPTESAARQLFAGRILLVLAGGVCLYFALGPHNVYGLVEEASAFGTAGVAVTTVTALFHKRPSGIGAAGALVAGVVAPPALTAFGAAVTFVPALVASFAVYFAAVASRRLTERPSM